MGEGEGFPAAPQFGAVPQYPIESVDNALRVLVLVGQHPGIRLMDVARHLGVASSTAHRLLAMLAYRGFLRQDTTTRGWTTGPTLDHLALDVLRRLDIRALAHPALERLCAHTGETIHLGRLHGNEVHFIDSIETTRALRVGGRLGRTMPAHCTSNGKAMLATLTHDQLLALYPDEHLPALTPHSITTRTHLLQALDQIRHDGYATSNEESEEGVASIGIALRPTTAGPHAITASAPLSRMTPTTRTTILKHLRTTADHINQQLP